MDPDRFIRPYGRQASDKVEIVIIIPTFRHSVFLIDAVSSALAQDTIYDYRVLIVDDGCPHNDTRRTALSFATAHPDRVHYIRRRNGGLSAARNTGVDYALARWPTARAFYFLDADNAIEPKAISRAYQCLRENPEIGWVYPSIKMFGSSLEYYDYSGPYSKLAHLKCNISEAASLVNRTVFDKGCRFDEQMRQGYEDWEFWLQCLEAGFTGRHQPDFGLRYRKRPESMLSASTRVHGLLVNSIQKKHGRLYSPKTLLSARGPTITVLTDTELARSGHRLDELTFDETFESALYKFANGIHEPYLTKSAQILATTTSEFLNILKDLRLGAYATWWLETHLNGRQKRRIAAIRITYDSDATGITIASNQNEAWRPNDRDLHLVAFAPAQLKDALEDTYLDWIQTLLTPTPAPPCTVLDITVPEELLDSSIPLKNALYPWFSVFKKLKSIFNAAPLTPLKKLPRTGPTLLEEGRIPSDLLECGPLFSPAPGQQKDVAFVVPILSFGGVEKVCINIAKQFKARGYRPHLFILGQKAAVSTEILAIFDSLIFYAHDEFGNWANPTENLGGYLGTGYPTWNLHGDSSELEGLLLPMDVVINFHAAHLHKVAQKLKKSGAVLASSIHVNDFTPHGRDVGHTFLTLGYEHVYDLIAPCSHAMLQTCNAFGVPLDKLVLVPNAPAYDMSDDAIRSSLSRRTARQAQSKRLNILFIGRLDRQKGLDRLLATLERSQAQGLPFDWRCVGSKVMNASDNSATAALNGVAEPAVHDVDTLTEIYTWADVLYMPSLWEGLPFTVLEAARVGAIPIVSDVGAVAEAIDHGETGFLVPHQPLEAYVETALRYMRTLADDRQRLARMSEQAARHMTRNWPDSTRAFIDEVGQLLNKRALSDAMVD